MRALPPHTRRVVLAYGLAMAALTFAAGLCIGHSIGTPRLVAIGCEGTSGPIYANEESDLPPCVIVGGA